MITSSDLLFTFSLLSCFCHIILFSQISVVLRIIPGQAPLVTNQLSNSGVISVLAQAVRQTLRFCQVISDWHIFCPITLTLLIGVLFTANRNIVSCPDPGYHYYQQDSIDKFDLWWKKSSHHSWLTPWPWTVGTSETHSNGLDNFCYYI